MARQNADYQVPPPADHSERAQRRAARARVDPPVVEHVGIGSEEEARVNLIEEGAQKKDTGVRLAHRPILLVHNQTALE